MERKQLVQAARDINKREIVNPNIDVSGTVSELRDNLLMAADLITDNDQLDESTRSVLKALKGGDTADETDRAGDEAGGTKTATKSKTEKTPKADAKPKEPKEPKEPKTPVVRVFKKDTLVYRLKAMVLQNPALTSDQIEAKLKDEGFKPGASTVSAFRQDFMHSLRVLKNNGYDIPGVEA